MGNGRSENQYEPVAIPTERTILDISAGGSHSAILSKEGVLFMCGDGSKGQLGIGECEQVFSIVPIKDHNVKKVACGENHSLILSALSGSGYTVKTCGANDKYQLGLST